MPDQNFGRRDPIRDLENFGTGGLTVKPLNPTEVRRLGNRRRARRNAGITVASVVAVIAAASPFALLANHGDESPLPPSQSGTPTPTPSRATGVVDTRTPTEIGLGDIPEDFPLGQAAVKLDGNAQKGPAADIAVDAPVLCGAPGLAAARANGRMAFENTGSEYVEQRELRSYADADAAAAVVESYRTALASCESWEADGITHTVMPLETDTGYKSVTFAEVVEPYGIGYQVTRVGRGVLVIRLGGEWTADALTTTGAEELAKLSRHVADDMCPFTTKGCVEDAPATATTQTDTIPADFPLALGAAAPAQREDRQGPGANVVVRSPTPCDAEPFTRTSATARLAFRQGGTAYDDLRELRVYDSESTANGVLQALATSVADCPHEAPAGFAEVDWVTLNTAFGPNAIAVSSRATNGAGDSTYLFAKVGRAILMIARGGTDRQNLAAITAVAQRITPHMCQWSDDGCKQEPSEATTGEPGTFGPTTAKGLTIGMDAAAVDKAGWTLMDEPGPCRGLVPPGGGVRSGYFHEQVGVVGIFATAGDRTPEGIGLGSTPAEVRAAYPKGGLNQTGYWIVDLPEGHYEISMGGTTVSEMILAYDGHLCWG